jgi:hypothetical protein
MVVEVIITDGAEATITAGDIITIGEIKKPLSLLAARRADSQTTSREI